MSWAGTSHDGDRKPGRRVVQMQGPRPSPLTVNKESRKIGKPPLPAPPAAPVIIYDVSPKVVHAEPSDFMSVVQRLTGISSSDSPPAAQTGWGGEPGPEHTGMGQITGILSPAPANLPEVTPGMFSQAMSTQSPFGFQDNLMSPLYRHYFSQSPTSSALFTGTTVSSPSQFDISKLFQP